MEIESIFSQPVARFVLRVCISVAGCFAQLLWERPVVRNLNRGTQLGIGSSGPNRSATPTGSLGVMGVWDWG